jgi:hypothetical protein
VHSAAPAFDFVLRTEWQRIGRSATGLHTGIVET